VVKQKVIEMENTYKDLGQLELVGQCFHSIDTDGSIQWQGVVLSRPEPGWYCVQLFEWFMGEPNVRKLVPIKKMKDWLFYKDVQEMNFSYEKGVAFHKNKKAEDKNKKAESLRNEIVEYNPQPWVKVSDKYSNGSRSLS